MSSRQAGSCIIAAALLSLWVFSWLPGDLEAAAVSPANLSLGRQSAAATGEAAAEKPAKPDGQDAQAAAPVADQAVAHRSFFAILLQGLMGESDNAKGHLQVLADNVPRVIREEGYGPERKPVRG